MFGKRCYENQFIDALNSIRNLDSAEILMNKFKNMLQEFQNYWNLKKSSESTNLGDVMGDVRNNINRVYIGCLNGDGHGKQLTQDWRNKKP